MRYSLVLFFVGIVFVTGSFAGKIGTNFAEVKVEGLQIGQTQSLKQIANMPFNVISMADEPVDLKLWAEMPKLEELKPGYEALPNPDWVKLEKETLKLLTRETGTSDIYITIPKEKRYLGKKYQVYIVVETVPPKGKGFIVFGVSLKGRLLITTADKIVKLETAEPVQEVNFLLRPWEIIIPSLEAGKFYNLYEEMGISLSLENPHNQSYCFRIESLTANQAEVELPGGFEDTPSSDFLHFDSTNVRFKKSGKEEIKVFFKFPNEDSYRNKKYLFVIRASLIDEKTGKRQVSVYSRVYVQTK
ncbi:MAG: hypothetical protein ABII74_01610 [Elusimicrobiota bacterium]